MGTAQRGAMAGNSDCERVRPSGLAQPVNTVTSTAYAVAALHVAGLARRSRGLLQAELLGYATALAGIAAGSVEYHARRPGSAHRLHDGALYAAVLLGSFVILPVLPRLDRARRRALLLCASAAAGAYGLGRTGSPLCRPDSPWQLHGLWHILSACTASLAALAARDAVVGRSS